MSKIFKNKKIILIVSLIFIIFFCVYLLNTPRSVSIKSEVNVTQKNELIYKYNIVGEKSVYDFMRQLQTEGKITFKDKTYSGMGKFIEEINGIKNGTEKNWIYYVNGIKANIGVSNYKINKGDIISWKYEK